MGAVPDRRADPRGAASSTLVLASGSRYRAALLADAGIAVEIDPPDVDERALDDRLDVVGPDGLAVELAVLKVLDVVPRHRDRWVLGADQVGVLDTAAGPVMLTKRPDVDGCVEQLLAMSGTTHRLVNGVVVATPDGGLHTGVDVQVVTMRAFDEAAARRYAERCAPFDTSGSYRLEDQEDMAPADRLVERVHGEDASGVLGLPLPLLRRLLRDAGFDIDPGS